MNVKLKNVPIGNDNFKEIRENGDYYIDKTMMIKDFIDYNDKVALVTRPRRFGKTLNMTMLREFFDITKDSRAIFEGLAIMETEYAQYINTRPVIFFTFKDCDGADADEIKLKLQNAMFPEYRRYAVEFEGKVDKDDLFYVKFYTQLNIMAKGEIVSKRLYAAIEDILTAVAHFYSISPVLLIDEYDQPLISSYDNGCHDKMKTFFPSFLGSGLKGNEDLGQSLLTGIQRVAKESIFSKLNNVFVYSVIEDQYSPYFGLTAEETKLMLEYYGYELNDDVREMYDGYLFGSYEMYNPWSVLSYAKTSRLKHYWTNTSTNTLIKNSLLKADRSFMNDFEKLITDGTVSVRVNLEASFIELKTNAVLWGLFINSGYLTVTDTPKMSQRIVTNASAPETSKHIAADTSKTTKLIVRIPNGEVKTEFQSIVAAYANISESRLENMFDALLDRDFDDFFDIYSAIVLECTSFYDSKDTKNPAENPYHMLFLGMCCYLESLYEVTSNHETGDGRHDIRMRSLYPDRPHFVFEFKQGEDVDKLKEYALNQIIEKRYCAGLHGNIICVGIAHNVKRCAIAHREITQ